MIYMYVMYDQRQIHNVSCAIYMQCTKHSMQLSLKTEGFSFVIFFVFVFFSFFRVFCIIFRVPWYDLHNK